MMNVEFCGYSSYGFFVQTLNNMEEKAAGTTNKTKNVSQEAVFYV